MNLLSTAPSFAKFLIGCFGGWVDDWFFQQKFRNASGKRDLSKKNNKSSDLFSGLHCWSGEKAHWLQPRATFCNKTSIPPALNNVQFSFSIIRQHGGSVGLSTLLRCVPTHATAPSCTNDSSWIKIYIFALSRKSYLCSVEFELVFFHFSCLFSLFTTDV